MPKTTSNAQLIGLALRAGKLIHGEEAVLEGFRKHSHFYVFIAHDAGANIQKKIAQKAHHYNITVNHEFDREALTRALGKSRTVCAITDKGFIELVSEG